MAGKITPNNRSKFIEPNMPIDLDMIAPNSARPDSS